MAERTIPADLRDICAEIGGHELLGGNLRSQYWPVPDELVIFGDNGQGDSFGLTGCCSEGRPTSRR